MRKTYLEKIKNRFAQLCLYINLDVCVTQFDFKSCPRHSGETDVAQVKASESGWLAPSSKAAWGQLGGCVGGGSSIREMYLPPGALPPRPTQLCDLRQHTSFLLLKRGGWKMTEAETQSVVENLRFSKQRIRLKD